MQVLNEKPPEWIMKGCLDQFRININTTFWTYGDTIYNPGGGHIPEDIIAHESVHAVQQETYEGGKDAWWREYLSNPRFRLEQEAAAYGHQYAHYCAQHKDRNQRDRLLRQITAHFSGPLYQLALTPTQARALILVLSGDKKLEQVA